jgi:hypothetical protein
MATARGANTRLLAKEEGTYGTNPGGSDWVQYPFNPPLTFGATQDLTQSPTIGISTNRDPGEPFRENVTVPLSAGLPIDLTHIGFWLHKLFGDATTTGSSNYTHVFKSGTFTALPSVSLEVGLPDLPRYFLYTGVKANSLSITAAPGGKPSASIGMIAQDEAESGTSVDSSPTVASSLVTFNNYQATLSREATALSYVTGFALNFANNIESIRDIGSGQNIREALESDTSISGTLTERLAATTLLADAVAATYKSFTILWEIGATQSLQIDLPRVHLQRVQKTIQGKAGIEIGWAWQAEYDSSAGAALVVTLKNQTASY